MILWIFALAYGRMTEALSWKPFAILAAISGLVTYLIRWPLGLPYPLEFLANLAGFVSLFLVGYAFGRWRAWRQEQGY